MSTRSCLPPSAPRCGLRRSSRTSAPSQATSAAPSRSWTSRRGGGGWGGEKDESGHTPSFGDDEEEEEARACRLPDACCSSPPDAQVVRDRAATVEAREKTRRWGDYLQDVTGGAAIAAAEAAAAKAPPQ